MSSTVEDVDTEALAAAAGALGTATPQATVNAALREVVRLRMVKDYVGYLKTLGQSDADPAGMWR